MYDLVIYLPTYLAYSCLFARLHRYGFVICNLCTFRKTRYNCSQPEMQGQVEEIVLNGLNRSKESRSSSCCRLNARLPASISMDMDNMTIIQVPDRNVDPVWAPWGHVGRAFPERGLMNLGVCWPGTFKVWLLSKEVIGCGFYSSG